jgi:hypothetical protein
LQGSICSVLCSVMELHHHAAESGRQKHPTWVQPVSFPVCHTYAMQVA